MRIAAQQMGYAGLGALHLSGLAALGYADTDTLPAGTVITFNVSSSLCLGFGQQDLIDGLNNWVGQMMKINSVSTTPLGYVPSQISLDVNATVTAPVTAGVLRGQIIAALAAFTTSAFACTISLTNNAINAASGSTAAPTACPSGTTANAQGVCVCSDGTSVPNALGICPSSTIPWTTIAIAGAIGVIGLVVLLAVVKR